MYRIKHVGSSTICRYLKKLTERQTKEKREVTGGARNRTPLHLMKEYRLWVDLGETVVVIRFKIKTGYWIPPHWWTRMSPCSSKKLTSSVSYCTDLKRNFLFLFQKFWLTWCRDNIYFQFWNLRHKRIF